MDEKNLLLAVYAQLERENTVSIPQLATLLDVSEEAVWEALEKLVFCYDAVSIRLDLQNSYATLERQGASRILRLTQAETEVLTSALEAQGYDSSSTLCAKLLESKSLLAQDQENEAGYLRIASVNKGQTAAIMELLAAACDTEQHHLLELSYQKEGAQHAEKRIVEPYEISSDGDHSYLQAFCCNAQQWRTFRCDRIQQARLLEASFKPRPGMPDPQQAREQDAQTAHIAFASKDQVPSWPRLSLETVHDDGSAVCSVAWFGGLWLPQHIAACMGAATPLDPPELVNATQSYVARLLEAAGAS